MRLGTAIECLVDNYKYASDKEWINDKVAWALYHTWKEADDRKTESNSEKPNSCEHITEDGVTCAKYPACDDCLDNPLNKLKGSERLVKGSEQTKPTISKMEQVEDEPPMDCKGCKHWKGGCDIEFPIDPQEDEDEPQSEDERIKDVVRGFMGIVDSMRNPTEEEMESVNNYLESISKPTGVNIFDMMDEPQTDCSWK